MARTTKSAHGGQWPIGKGLLVLLLLCMAGFFTVGALASSTSSSSSAAAAAASLSVSNQLPPSSSQTPPSPDADLICHTDNASDCYPRVFQPTHEFQVVHDDQVLPPGLHVRLSMETGEKEAKLNNASDEGPAALAGLPVDQSVVLVDQPAAADDSSSSISSENSDIGAASPPVPKGAPAYDPVGKVKDPGAISGRGAAAASTQGEGQAFYDAVAILKGVALGAKDQTGVSVAVADALAQLDEFAHDMYYGLKLVEDEDAMRALLCVMSGGSGSGSGSDSGAGAKNRQPAAAIVASALQNNLAALRALERSWGRHKATTCGRDQESLGRRIFALFSDEPDEAVADLLEPAWVRSRLSAINGLIKSEAIMQDFLRSGGLDSMLRLLVDVDETMAVARSRAAHLVVDNFLDETMGADVTLWADAPGASRWDEPVQKLAERHRGEHGHWSGELWRHLRERRGGGDSSGSSKDAVHDEL